MKDLDRQRIQHNAIRANDLMVRASAYLLRAKTTAENSGGYESPEYVIAMNALKSMSDSVGNLEILINRTKTPVV